MQNKCPHHSPRAWETLSSVNVADGIWVRNGKRQQEAPPEVLKTTAPSYATDEHFIGVGAGFGSDGNTKSAPQPDKTTFAKTNSGILSCEIGERKSIGVVQDKHYKCIAKHYRPSPFHPSSPDMVPEASDEKTDIVKWHIGQTLQNQCETTPTQEPQNKTK